MAANYGFDLSCVDGLTAELRTVSGKRLLAEALVRRLITPRGMLLDDPNYGTDVREYIGHELTKGALARMKAEIQAELLKDERVIAVTVTRADFLEANRKLVLELAVEAGEDAFPLVVSISDVNVNLLTPE